MKVKTERVKTDLASKINTYAPLPHIMTCSSFSYCDPISTSSGLMKTPEGLLMSYWQVYFRWDSWSTKYLPGSHQATSVSRKGDHLSSILDNMQDLSLNEYSSHVFDLPGLGGAMADLSRVTYTSYSRTESSTLHRVTGIWGLIMDLYVMLLLFKSVLEDIHS
jgi:hypothetical protein